MCHVSGIVGGDTDIKKRRVPLREAARRIDPGHPTALFVSRTLDDLRASPIAP